MSAQDLLSLKGKIAIVTGSGRPNGIGAAIAYAIAAQGAKVIVHFVSDGSAEKAAEVVKQVKALGSDAIAVQADLQDVGTGKVLVDAALKGFNVKTIDIIVNNAGVLSYFSNASDAKLADWDLVYNTNVRGAYFLVTAAMPYLAPGASIVNVGSVVGGMGSARMNIYASSKAALHALTLGFAEELGLKHGIRVNTISPGPIETDLMPPDDEPQLIKFRATRRLQNWGQSEDVANTVLFLSSRMGRHIQGQRINVDGGILY